VEYPALQFAAIECGFAWLPALIWRLDKNWKSCRSQVPWLERPPSEYVREHVRLATQLFPTPERPEHVRAILDAIHAEETLLFASDYPHWDNDDPDYALRYLDGETRDRVAARNARDLYGLPADPADPG